MGLSGPKILFPMSLAWSQWEGLMVLGRARGQSQGAVMAAWTIEGTIVVSGRLRVSHHQG